MDPRYLVGMGMLGALMAGGGIGLSKAPTPEQLEQMRLDREKQKADRRAASPAVAAAEAKRARKAAKLRRVSQ